MAMEETVNEKERGLSGRSRVRLICSSTQIRDSHIPENPPIIPYTRARTKEILRVERRRRTMGARRRASSDRTMAAVAVRMAIAGPGREERRSPREILTVGMRRRRIEQPSVSELLREETRRESKNEREENAETHRKGEPEN